MGKKHKNGKKHLAKLAEKRRSAEEAVAGAGAGAGAGEEAPSRINPKILVAKHLKPLPITMEAGDDYPFDAIEHKPAIALDEAALAAIPRDKAVLAPVISGLNALSFLAQIADHVDVNNLTPLLLDKSPRVIQTWKKLQSYFKSVLSKERTTDTDKLVWLRGVAEEDFEKVSTTTTGGFDR